MTFKPDPSKEAQEKIFSRKCTNEDHPPIYFNNMLVTQTTNQKILGCFLMKNVILVQKVQHHYPCLRSLTS